MKEFKRRDDKVMAYEIIMSICYHLTGKNVANVGDANKCLAEFRRLLEEQKFEDGTVKVNVVSITNFGSKQKDLETVALCHTLKLNVIDHESVWASNRNKKVEPMIHNHFRSLKLSGTFGQSDFRINVVDSATAGEVRNESLWPAEENRTQI